MPSEISELYVWVWLPGNTEPVPAGLLVTRGDTMGFSYGARYLERPDAISLSPTLPLGDTFFEPTGYMAIPGAIRDSAPDVWGRRVILNRMTGSRGHNAETGDLAEATYLIESDSNRIGALDFQRSPREYVARRDRSNDLSDLLQVAESVAVGEHIPESLHDAVLSGTGIGGARPKVLVTLDGVPSLVKFSVSTDVFPAVQAEALASSIAVRAGMNTSSVHSVSIGGKFALVSDRFDRVAHHERRIVLTALTIVERDESEARYSSYPEIVARVREHAESPDEIGPEFFRRIAFNMMISNNDDHLRNHAAFWNGKTLSLTPVYDLTPAARREGAEITQTLPYGNAGEKIASLHQLISQAELYSLSRREARRIVDQLIGVVDSELASAADEMQIPSGVFETVRGSFLHETVVRDLPKSFPVS